MGTNPSWKQTERRVARYVGAQRNPGSGAAHTTTRSDSTHSTLFIETKHGKIAEQLLCSPRRLRRLFEEVARRALAEGKVPVVVLHPTRWGNGGVGEYPAFVRVNPPGDLRVEGRLFLRDGAIACVTLSEVRLAVTDSQSTPKGGDKKGQLT